MKKIFMILWGCAVMALFGISCLLAYTEEQREVYQWAYQNKITTQPSIEAARLDSPLTRQAFAKMIINYLENVVWIKPSLLSSCYFLDENIITDDLKPYVKKVCAYQIMWLDWKRFNPTHPIDRAQLWTVFSRILWWDEYNNSWKGYYIYHVNALQSAGIMNNIKNVVGTPAKRGDVMLMFKRMYEKFGSNVYLNWNQIGAYNTTVYQSNNTPGNQSNNNYENEYISGLYSNSNVIYTWEDGTKYYYDYKFLNMLKNVAEKKWESDLVNYLKIEAEYFKNWLDQLANLDDEELLKAMWIDMDDIDPDNMTDKQKEELIGKFKAGFSKIIKENKEKNNNTLKNLEAVTKNISNDKFWLKEKYNKTKAFMETSNAFLDVYSESMFSLIEIALNDDEDTDSEEWMAQAFSLIWVALAYQWEAQEYQNYVEERWVSTLKLLWIN